MSRPGVTVVGIDVGGERKGFHAVAMQDGHFVDPQRFTDPAAVVDWCLDHSACLIAVDAPCAWSQAGSSRLAERELNVGGQVIQCFKTPTRERAMKNESGFYGWVFNGEKLYQELARHYTLFDGNRREGQAVLETFPHAVVCALAGKVVAAKPKTRLRRESLRNQGYDDSGLSNIDFVDAALCALAAEAFLADQWQSFGDQSEGFIVVPQSIFPEPMGQLD